MIVLDTNVLSELVKPSPDSNVIQWVSQRPVAALFTSTITQAEILYGVSLLPDGDRKKQLQKAVVRLFDELFHERVLPFDGDAAMAYARIAVSRRQSGRPISQFDAQIAAIARSRESQLATRNGMDFEGCGIVVINPWLEQTG
ncbi:MAG: type II toxin-antitoxin system VapC family toxin [Balneolaceae bacterium]|nr:MAG: type II toxin-antitoxin system VapC family toxin [Balneolaceae bacterium]